MKVVVNLLLKTICFWIDEFKRCRSQTKVAARFGRPVEVPTKDFIEKINGIIMDNRHVKVLEVAETAVVKIVFEKAG